MRNREQLEIVFDLNAIDDASALRMIMGVINKLGFPNEFEFDSTRIACQDFLKQVERTGRWSHEVRSGGMGYRYGVVSAWRHSFIHVAEQEAGASRRWDDWIAPFVGRSGFVQAWISDINFDYWQNAQDILQYEDAGRDWTGLPMVSNGLPPPLEQQVIDTSRNPGRRIIRDGYVEAVGARMWLGPSFWERIGGRVPEERLTAAGWTLTDLQEEVTLLQTVAESFQEAASVDQQIALRSAIYELKAT